MNKAILLFLLSISTFSSASAQVSEQYVVASPTLSMRSAEGKEENLVATLSKNDAVRVLKTNPSGWWEVDLNGKQGFVDSHFLKKRSNDGWIATKYESGDTPNCENVKPQFDTNLDNHLKIIVNSHSDVMLKLMKIQKTGDVCIRTAYVESSDYLVINNIPEGKYYLKLAYGTDWRQKKVAGKCVGRFIQNAQYEIGKERLNYNVIRINNRVDVPSYSLSLGVKSKKDVDATFNTNNISEAEFNK